MISIKTDVQRAEKVREAGVPDCLNRHLPENQHMNRPKPPIEIAKPKISTAKIGPNEQRLREMKAEKARGRIAKMKAKQSGATAKLPPQGKEAVALIKSGEPFGVASTKPPASAAANPEDSSVKTSAKTKTEKPKGKPSSARRSTTKKTAARSSARSAKTNGVRPGSKLEIIVGLLKRKEGCTTADVLAACHWPAVSMPQQAKAAGLKLRKQKDGKVSRYFAE